MRLIIDVRFFLGGGDYETVAVFLKLSHHLNLGFVARTLNSWETAHYRIADSNPAL